MPHNKPYKSERHRALDDFCCNGDCNQGRTCPREPRPPPHFTLWDGLMAVGLVATMAFIVFMGPMFQRYAA